jgi:hypothetical protein
MDLALLRRHTLDTGRGREFRAVALTGEVQPWRRRGADYLAAATHGALDEIAGALVLERLLGGEPALESMLEFADQIENLH